MNQNGNAINANKIAKPIETIMKSISQATNLSIQLANIISTGALSLPPPSAVPGEELFDEDTFLI